MGAREVPHDAITEAAEAVAEKIDVLLERATDHLLGAPQPGSEAWRQQWDSRDTEACRAELAHRTRVRIAIARATGVDPLPEPGRAGRAGILAGETIAESPGKPQRRRRSGTVTIRC
ncbi:hypothetical protein M2284_005267 [Rhodococcus sp. LBL1]|nr:hypothetical protein [Rhodococcus sp. LBL1]MDH6686330.1 hypothetical protein [Rhodococcus sp. LBL2]